MVLGDHFFPFTQTLKAFSQEGPRGDPKPREQHPRLSQFLEPYALFIATEP